MNRGAIPLAIIGAILLAVATRWMTVLRVEPSPVRAILVDVSASATRPSPQYSLRVREQLEAEALAAEDSGEQFLVVVSGSDTRHAFGPGPAARFREQLRGESGRPFDPLQAGEPGTRTELAKGVRLIRALLADFNLNRVSLLTIGDGSFTGEDPASAVRQLVANGVHWRGNILLRPELTDVSLSALRFAKQLEPGAPLVGSIRVDVRAGESGEPVWDRVEVTAEDAQGLRRTYLDLWDSPSVAASEDSIRSGASVHKLAFGPVRPGRTVIRARLVSAEGAPSFDPLPENDSTQCVVLAGAPLVVGWFVSPELESELSTYAASLPDSFSSLILQTDEVAAALPELDALFVFDRSLEDLPGELCRSFVQSGGGLFVAGGWNLLSGWDSGPEGGRLAEILPLQPGSEEPSLREVLVLVDGSGSMAGEPFRLVREAVRELVRAAPPRDEIGLAFFTVALHSSRLLRRGGSDHGSFEDRERIASELLDTRVPGGPTRIIESLEELADRRATAQNEALVLLLSDGREAADVPDAELRAERLREQWSASGTELIVFAVGEEANLEFLRTLVSDDNDLHAGDELDDLGHLFSREVNRERVREADEIRALARTGALASELLPAEFEPAPFTRLLRMRSTSSAELVLVSDQGEPLLACQRVGRGRAIQLASLPFPDWGAAWTARLSSTLR